MFASYLKTALRIITRQKGYSFINIAGLAIGIASSLVVFLWVADETSYDKFHSEADSIYRCYREVVWNGERRFSEVTSAPIGPAAAERTPGIAHYTRTYNEYAKLSYETESVSGLGMYVDPAFLKVFSFPLVEGDSLSALSAPNSIVLTQHSATSLFGIEDPVGKVLKSGQVITAVAADVPDNSSLEFDFLMPMAYAEQTGQVSPDAWYNFGFETFFLLEKSADVANVSQKISDLYKEVDPEATLKLHLQPLTDIHLRNLEGGGRIVYVWVFSIVAILLLGVACVNFTNLATARAAKRISEMGLRKAVGASRQQLAAQAMTESVIQAVASMLLAVCLLEAAGPWLERLFGKPLVVEYSFGLVTALAVITFLVALAAGSYPALVLSSFHPASALKGKNSAGGSRSANRLRKTLVVFQFTVSTGLIFAALVINAQLDYIEKKDLGIDRQNIVTVRTDGLHKDYVTLRDELIKNPSVLGVTAVFQPPAWCGWYANGFDFEGRPEDISIRAGVAWVDHDYVDVFGLNIIEGRNFSRQFATDETDAYIVNESAVRAMGMDSPVGKSLDMGDRPGKIVGVVKDFHFSSLHTEIGPLVLGIDKTYFQRLCIKLPPDDVAGGLAAIEKTFAEFRYGDDFRYRFFDDLLGREYETETRTGRIVLSFTLITVLVACLGLFGLAAYSAERRTKEIGIRKVLGSSTNGIIGLLTKEFVLLVLLGNLIVAPLAYYSADRWLGNFAYRVELGWEFFALSSGLAVMIALVTVCYQAIKAARSDPVDALKYE